MSYVTGSSGPQANPAQYLYERIVEAFNAGLGWSYVGSVTIGSNTHQVWKNLGTGTGANFFGQDFYLDFQYAASGTTLRVRAFESFIDATDHALRPVVPYATSLTPNSNNSFGDEATGYTLEAAQMGAYVDLLASASGFDYDVHTTVNRLCAASRYSTTDTACYAGLFESFLASDPFPLCLIGTSGNETFYTYDAGVSRHPGRTTAAAYNFVHRMVAFSAISGSADTEDLLHGSAFASRALLEAYNNPVTTYGRMRGLLYDVALLPDGATATRNGDTIAGGGDTWARMKFGTSGYASGAWVNTDAE